MGAPNVLLAPGAIKSRYVPGDTAQNVQNKLKRESGTRSL